MVAGKVGFFHDGRWRGSSRPWFLSAMFPPYIGHGSLRTMQAGCLSVALFVPARTRLLSFCHIHIPSRCSLGVAQLTVIMDKIHRFNVVHRFEKRSLLIA